MSLNKYTYCHNQPVTGYDPDGHALHILAGAVIGGVIGGAMSYASQAWKNKSFTKGINWKQVAGGAVEGAITGAIGAATGGASIAATAAKSGLKTAAKFAVKKIATNTASGFIANSANQLISSGGKSYDVKEALVSGLSENIDIPGGDAAEKTAKKVGSEIVDKVGDSFKKKAGNEVAEAAGAEAVQKTLGNSAEAGMSNVGKSTLLNKKVISASDEIGDAIPGATKLVPKGEGEQFGINALKAKQVDGYHDVIIHGSVNSDLSTKNKFSVFHNGSFVEIDHRSLAKYIKKDSNYNGESIRLLSCATGADAKGIAQDLANKLGVEVMAPSDILWAFPNGKLTIGKNQFINDGVWNHFKPGEH